MNVPQLVSTVATAGSPLPEHLLGLLELVVLRRRRLDLDAVAGGRRRRRCCASTSSSPQARSRCPATTATMVAPRKISRLRAWLEHRPQARGWSATARRRHGDACDHDRVTDRPAQIPTRTRLIGRALNASVAHAPWLWPVLRRPMRASSTGPRRAGTSAPARARSTTSRRSRPPPRRSRRRPSASSTSGTGTGEGALFLAREFPRARVRGVDLSEEMIRDRAARRSASTPRAGSRSRSPTPRLPYERRVLRPGHAWSTCRPSSPRSPACCGPAVT